MISLTSRVPSPAAAPSNMTVHLVNPSHLSFGVGVITPRWLESRDCAGTLAEAHRTLAGVEAELDRLRPWLRAELWHGNGSAVETI